MVLQLCVLQAWAKVVLNRSQKLCPPPFLCTNKHVINFKNELHCWCFLALCTEKSPVWL